jgi:hypothetical protein
VGGASPYCCTLGHLNAVLAGWRRSVNLHSCGHARRHISPGSPQAQLAEAPTLNSCRYTRQVNDNRKPPRHCTSTPTPVNMRLRILEEGSGSDRYLQHGQTREGRASGDAAEGPNFGRAQRQASPSGCSRLT